MAPAVELVDLRQLNLSASTAVPASASRSRGSSIRSVHASLTSRWPDSKPKFPASPQRPESSRSASIPARRSSSRSASQPRTACWWQCTWASARAERSGTWGGS
ncbi:hypothetical protein ACFWWC_22170 [Streptomyces sp. NPDC058642]|uniref:hypothetical protein n=1 Tax=Streptomyces sp. NPDC058642 TaxID=3346572 RepID=UPI003647B5EC